MNTAPAIPPAIEEFLQPPLWAASKAPNDDAPDRASLLWMALVALAMRVLLVLVYVQHAHITLEKLATYSDGVSYTRYAKALYHEPSGITVYDRRVSPGYPLAIGAIHLLGLSVPFAALLISWVCAGLAAPLAALLTNSRRIGWAMAVLIPHYVMFSSIVANEALMLALVLFGLVLAVRHHQIAVGGAVIGFAGLVRPMAAFAVAGFMFDACYRRRWRDALTFGGAALLIVILNYGVLQHANGAVSLSYRVYRDSPGAYNGELFTWPFKSLIFTPLYFKRPLSKTIYVYAHAAIVLPACIWMIWRMLKVRPLSQLDVVCGVWLNLNTLFVLCTGSVWGFEAFHRFISWALPALFWAIRPLLPRSMWIWAMIGAVSFVVALQAITHVSV